MANASSKRIASANDAALASLARNLIVVNVLAFAIRYIKSYFFSSSIVPSRLPLALQIITFTGTIFIWRWFAAIGTPRRDGQGGVKVGDDLAGKGIIEMAWDMIYMTWICTLGSALLGNWIWWFILAIPAFAGWKLFSTVRPLLAMFLPGIFGASSPRDPAAAGPGGNAAEPEKTESRKQAKLRARMEKGDKRVQQVQR